MESEIKLKGFSGLEFYLNKKNYLKIDNENRSSVLSHIDIQSD